MTSIIKEDTNYLEVKIDNINPFNIKVFNTIRRLILSEIPVYGFHPDNINIDSNTGVLHNDIIRHRISGLPIQLLKETNNEHLNISININIKNDNNDGQNLEVNTDNCIVKVNNNIRKNMFPSPPIIICNLKENQELVLNAVANYDKGAVNANYYDVGYSYFWEREKENIIVLTIEGKGQLECKDIFNKACNIYIEKLKEVQNKFHEHENIEKYNMEIMIENENYTMGDLLLYEIQNNKNIEFASFKKEHQSVNNIIININTNKSKTVKQIVDQSIKKLSDLFFDIQLK